MNFRQGFLRLWVVGSVLFVVAVGLFSYEQVTTEFERSGSGQYWSKDPVLFPVDCRDARGKSGIDYKSDIVDPFDKSGSVRNCWYKIDALRRLYPEYNDLSDDVLSTKLYQKAAISIKEPAAPWKTLGIVLLIAIGVPVLALLLGAALAWVLSGFAAPRSPPP